jgi:hypothetical protein
MQIVFMARETKPISADTPGHIFFCIQVPLVAGLKEDCFGFYPDDPLKSFDGPGNIVNEFTMPAMGDVKASLSHRISADARKAAYDQLADFTGASYKLHVNNCIDFVFAVAKAVGLKTPNRATVTLPTEALAGMQSRYWEGSWQSDDPQTRFQFEIAGASAEWTERDTTGKALKVQVPFAAADDNVRVERPNSPQVLSHLGFQSTVAGEITAAGPQPSFFILRRIDDRLEGQWNGLVAIKDTAGHLKQLKQPGSTPAKAFTFSRIY